MDRREVRPRRLRQQSERGGPILPLWLDTGKRDHFTIALSGPREAMVRQLGEIGSHVDNVPEVLLCWLHAKALGVASDPWAHDHSSGISATTVQGNGSRC